MTFELEKVSTNLQSDGDGLALVKVNIQKIQHCAGTEWEDSSEADHTHHKWPSGDDHPHYKCPSGDVDDHTYHK